MYDTYSRYMYISIHALRGEGDPTEVTSILTPIDFNPRPPWGGRLNGRTNKIALEPFQSTPSVGRATRIALFLLAWMFCISIHALRGEGDADGAATGASGSAISIHALRGEGDLLVRLIM